MLDNPASGRLICAGKRLWNEVSTPVSSWECGMFFRMMLLLLVGFLTCGEANKDLYVLLPPARMTLAYGQHPIYGAPSPRCDIVGDANVVLVLNKGPVHLFEVYHLHVLTFGLV